MSELRWQLPSSWQWASVSNISEVFGGGTPSSKDETNFAEDGIPWVTPADLTGYKEAYIAHGARYLSQKGYAESGARLLPKGTVLFSSRAPIGYCAIAENEIATNQGFKSLVLRGDMSPEFVRYYLLASKEYAESKASGTTFLELSGARVSELAVPVAPAQEQRRIVEKLDGLMARTARARADLDRIPSLIANYKKSILAAAFSGELTKEWQTTKNSPAPVLKRVGELITDIRYGTAQKCYPEQKGIAVLRIPNINSGNIDLTELKYTELALREIRKLELQVGDILVVRSNGSAELVGLPAVVSHREVGMAFAGYLIRLRPNQQKIHPKYLALMLRAPQTRGTIETSARSTSGVHNINSGELSALSVPLPELEEQSEIVRRIEAAFAWIDRLTTEYARAGTLLPKLDSAILSKAFRGDLVPQDPNDEPAPALLTRISASHSANLKTRKTRLPSQLKTPKAKPRMTKSRFDEDVKNKPYLRNIIFKYNEVMQFREDNPMFATVISYSGVKTVASIEAIFESSGLGVVDFYKQLDWEISQGLIRSTETRLEPV